MPRLDTPATMHGMTGIELANHLRLLSGYHLGTDLLERLAHAQCHQQQQRDALAQAADEIERLMAELKACKATPLTRMLQTGRASAFRRANQEK